MPTDRDTLELLRLYHAWPRRAQRTVLTCAKLLHVDPPARQGRSIRPKLIEYVEDFSLIYLRQPRRGRPRPTHGRAAHDEEHV
jgi:hypothetical protein